MGSGLGLGLGLGVACCVRGKFSLCNRALVRVPVCGWQSSVCAPHG